MRSITLVGTATSTARTQDPISAARRWLDDPIRSARLDPSLRARAHQAIDVAATHVHQLELLASEVAQQFEEAGAADPSRVTYVSELATVFEQFSVRLRELLDESFDQQDASERLARGLEAAESSGLPGLVARL
ncbi:MAG: hypothetical protein KDC46_14390 [Thermoleophilia bacterium]|nr:hypothetical protein [Thermoleophilia bacterium]